MIWTLLACLPDLSERLERVDTAAPVDTAEVADPDGPVSVELDATDYTAWVDLDLDLTGGDYELQFQRYLVALNPETGVEATWIDGVDFDAVGVDDLPEQGWQVDLPDQDGDGEPERVFDDWYLYDSSDHSLSPVDRVYLIRSPYGSFKFVFESYYNQAGTPAKLLLRWQRLTLETER